MLDNDVAAGMLSDVDVARLEWLIRSAAVDPQRLSELTNGIAAGAGSLWHESGQRDYPLAERSARHDVRHGLVRLGRVARHPGNPLMAQEGENVLSLPHLATSVLVIGPPGSGKTRGIACPITEALCLAALTGRASVVVLDVKGDDFRPRGEGDRFDMTVDLSNPGGGMGFDLYGSAAHPGEATDRLASALLPNVSADKQFFRDSAQNALHEVLAPFHAAFDRYPTVAELLTLLQPGGRRSPLRQSLRDRLHNRGRLEEYERLLERRERSQPGRIDPAASLYERVALLDRAHLHLLLDTKGPRLDLGAIDRPIRIRVALNEGSYPEASRILARLVVSQFVQTVQRRPEGSGILSVLVVDEAGRYLDDYVASGLQRLRSRNAGLVLLTQSIADLPIELRSTILGSVGGKVVFGGVGPEDAQWFADYFGKHERAEISLSAGTGASDSHTAGAFAGMGYLPARQGRGAQQHQSMTTRQVEKYRWTPSEIGGLPTGHALVSLALPDGTRTGAQLTSLREP